MKPSPQDHSLATYAPILRKQHGFVDWRLPANVIHNRIRAFNPWPGAVARFRGKVCKILKARVYTAASHEPSISIGGPGAIVVSKRLMAVVCGDGELLEILQIQPENRKPVTGVEFANGARITPGENFESVEDNVGES
jgi:methionyl-tRNA formyltransferase